VFRSIPIPVNGSIFNSKICRFELNSQESKIAEPTCLYGDAKHQRDLHKLTMQERVQIIAYHVCEASAYNKAFPWFATGCPVVYRVVAEPIQNGIRMFISPSSGCYLAAVANHGLHFIGRGCGRVTANLDSRKPCSRRRH
jgi:hypothetical protein